MIREATRDDLSLLLGAAVEAAAQCGAEDLTLHFAVGNHEAEQFWARLGFVPAIQIANATLEAVRERIQGDFDVQ